MTGCILTLDLATQTGWALGVPGGQVDYGTLRLGAAGKDQSKRFATFAHWLRTKINECDVEAVCFEAPRDPRHMVRTDKRTGQKVPLTSFATTRMLLGLCAITEAETRLAGITPTEAEVAQVRRHLFSGPTPRKADVKKLVIDRLNMLGYRPQDDNAADALALWLYASAVLAPGADIATPLPLGRGQ